MRKYANKKVTDLKIAYIGGGSRGWAWRFMADLALDPQLSGTVHLYDIDEDAAKRNEVIGKKIMDNKEAKAEWDFVTSSSLEAALTDADFVLISILPGTFEEMASDVHCPEKYGIYQAVGDTVGPGGIIRALRTLPMIAEIGGAVKEYCPNAWVINYTNPMSLCVRVLYQTFPEIKAFGCCHEVFGIQSTLGTVVEKTEGITGVTREDIHVNVIGLNHFTWFTEANYQGIDLLPVYEKYLDEVYAGKHDGEDGTDRLKSKNGAKLDMLKNYGALAAAGDRHLVEFMPGRQYLKDPETVEKWGFSLTSVDSRKEDLKKRMEKSDHLIDGTEEPNMHPSGEEGVKMIKSLCGLDRYISNVNLPNTAKQIPNFPKHTVVETNAVFGKDNIQPIYAGICPENIYRLELPHIENQDRVLEAAMTCNKELVIDAFKNDPLVKYRINEEEIIDLVNEMIKNTLTYLPMRWNELVD